jgi:hypothetical protein
MSSLSELDLAELRLEERSELAARRDAADLMLLIVCQSLDPMNRVDDEYELHLLANAPLGWRCLAVRRSWGGLRRLLEECGRPMFLRRLHERAKPCALHATAASHT